MHVEPRHERAAPNITVGDLVVAFTPAQTLSLVAVSPSRKGTDPAFAFFRGGRASLGDVTIQTATAGGGWAGWRSSPTMKVVPLNTSDPHVLLAADVTPAIVAAAPAPSSTPSVAAATPVPATPPFTLRRQWETRALPSAAGGAALLLRLTLANAGASPLTVGALGLPLPFPWSAGSPAGDLASTFVDPSITGQHGFATVTRLSGKHEVLLVTSTAANAAANRGEAPRASLEAWHPATEVPNGVGLDGTQEWLVHSKAYEASWNNASGPFGAAGKQWLEPTAHTLAPAGTKGSSLELAFLFSIAADVRSKDAALEAAGNALVHGVPGFVLASDMTSAKVLVKPPGSAKLVSATSDRPKSLKVGAAGAVAASPGWVAVPLQAQGDDRVRLTLAFSDGTTQVVNYRTMEAFDQHVDRCATRYTRPPRRAAPHRTADGHADADADAAFLAREFARFARCRPPPFWGRGVGLACLLVQLFRDAP